MTGVFRASKKQVQTWVGRKWSCLEKMVALCCVSFSVIIVLRNIEMASADPIVRVDAGEHTHASSYGREGYTRSDIGGPAIAWFSICVVEASIFHCFAVFAL